MDTPTAPTEAPAPWTPPGSTGRRMPRTPRKADWGRALPFVGPLVLFIVWDLVVRLGFIKPILLPPPMDALGALLTGLAGGPLLNDFLVTVWRTVQAFLIAALVGMPLGVLLGSNEKAYRSVEFLIDFFRSTPSSALIPLFLMIFGVSDINKVAIAAFGRFADRDLQQRLRRDQCAQAARDGGQGDGRHRAGRCSRTC
jgi:ABC-type nitrate/sulfonate/bicarbonate transport system permease component